MRTGDKKAIEEIWSVFEKSFNQQRKEQQTQVTFVPYNYMYMSNHFRV